jgi:hypothetical protein
MRNEVNLTQLAEYGLQALAHNLWEYRHKDGIVRRGSLLAALLVFNACGFFFAASLPQRYASSVQRESGAQALLDERAAVDSRLATEVLAAARAQATKANEALKEVTREQRSFEHADAGVPPPANPSWEDAWRSKLRADEDLVEAEEAARNASERLSAAMARASDANRERSARDLCFTAIGISSFVCVLFSFAGFFFLERSRLLKQQLALTAEQLNPVLERLR